MCVLVGNLGKQELYFKIPKSWYITTFGPSGVRALPLAAGINEGGHYFRYWAERRCADGV